MGAHSSKLAAFIALASAARRRSFDEPSPHELPESMNSVDREDIHDRMDRKYLRECSARAAAKKAERLAKAYKVSGSTPDPVPQKSEKKPEVVTKLKLRGCKDHGDFLDRCIGYRIKKFNDIEYLEKIISTMVKKQFSEAECEYFSDYCKTAEGRAKLRKLMDEIRQVRKRAGNKCWPVDGFDRILSCLNEQIIKHVMKCKRERLYSTEEPLVKAYWCELKHFAKEYPSKEAGARKFTEHVEAHFEKYGKLGEFCATYAGVRYITKLRKLVENDFSDIDGFLDKINRLFPVREAKIDFSEAKDMIQNLGDQADIMFEKSRKDRSEGVGRGEIAGKFQEAFKRMFVKVELLETYCKGNPQDVQHLFKTLQLKIKEFADWARTSHKKKNKENGTDAWKSKMTNLSQDPIIMDVEMFLTFLTKLQAVKSETKQYYEAELKISSLIDTLKKSYRFGRQAGIKDNDFVNYRHINNYFEFLENAFYQVKELEDYCKHDRDAVHKLIDTIQKLQDAYAMPSGYDVRNILKATQCIDFLKAKMKDEWSECRESVYELIQQINSKKLSPEEMLKEVETKFRIEKMKEFCTMGKSPEKDYNNVKKMMDAFNTHGMPDCATFVRRATGQVGDESGARRYVDEIIRAAERGDPSEDLERIITEKFAKENMQDFCGSRNGRFKQKVLKMRDVLKHKYKKCFDLIEFHAAFHEMLNHEMGGEELFRWLEHMEGTHSRFFVQKGDKEGRYIVRPHIKILEHLLNPKKNDEYEKSDVAHCDAQAISDEFEDEDSEDKEKKILEKYPWNACGRKLKSIINDAKRQARRRQ